MLILTRRIGESIVIGEEVFCTILGFYEGDRIKLGFDAPETFPINRYEIQCRINQKQRQGIYDTRLNCDETVVDRLIAKYKLPSHPAYPH
ncbi:TPA: carbon storage regulator [Legionella pneumophila]